MGVGERAFGVPDDLEIDEARVAAVKRELESAGVEHCFAFFVDVHGIPKSKAVPLSCFEKMCRGGELYTVGANEGLGLAGPHEDECATVPDLDSLAIFPWDPRQASFAADLYYHGAPYANDPRGILRRVMARGEALGLRPMLGIEPELYVLKETPDGLRPITTSSFGGPNACYDVALTLESMDFLRPMRAHLEALGWGLYSFDQECGKGQYELDFGYADAVTMADRFIFLRMMARQVALSIGARVSYMPKPFSDDFRSGAHFNMSCASIETGENVFEADAPGELGRKCDVAVSDLALHFTAGLLRHAGAITALCCPTYNSYQGLVAQGALREFSWAPVLALWGRNNRSAMLRLPGNRACVENRAVDMATNPYLAAALCFAAGLEGIEQRLDPGDGASDDLYRRSRRELKALGIDSLPPTLLHAIEAFEEDPLVGEVMGEEFRSLWVDQKRSEWDEAFYHVSDWQRERALSFP